MPKTTKWRCVICNYIHEGPEPPEICPVCGAPKSDFEPVEEDEDDGKQATPGPNVKAKAASAAPVAPLSPSEGGVSAGLGLISYGLFIVSGRRGGSSNGQTGNTVFQVTSEPQRVAIGINKRNYTHEFLSEGGVVAITVLGQDNMDLVRSFGFRSGRDVDKFAGVDHWMSPQVGCPVLSQGLAYLELGLDPARRFDAGTHTLFLGDVVGGGPLREGEPLTYAYYRANRSRTPT